MASCAKCDELLASLSFDKPREYLELVLKLMGSVKEGDLTVTGGTCSLQDLFNDQWPADIVEHNFECAACGRPFQLFADTYHGHGGWGVTGPQTREPALSATASS